MVKTAPSCKVVVTTSSSESCVVGLGGVLVSSAGFVVISDGQAGKVKTISWSEGWMVVTDPSGRVVMTGSSPEADIVITTELPGSVLVLVSSAGCVVVSDGQAGNVNSKKS